MAGAPWCKAKIMIKIRHDLNKEFESIVQSFNSSPWKENMLAKWSRKYFGDQNVCLDESIDDIENEVNEESDDGVNDNLTNIFESNVISEMNSRFFNPTN
ncbi:hypothetical protein BLOT_004744 [Blomia tropicalis]|nr:hypothetical protein BLOT_004744 [Blomia tropicalis]